MNDLLTVLIKHIEAEYSKAILKVNNVMANQEYAIDNLEEVTEKLYDVVKYNHLINMLQDMLPKATQQESEDAVVTTETDGGVPE